jgi:hypothetical protein
MNTYVRSVSANGKSACAVEACLPLPVRPASKEHRRKLTKNEKRRIDYDDDVFKSQKRRAQPSLTNRRQSGSRKATHGHFLLRVGPRTPPNFQSASQGRFAALEPGLVFVAHTAARMITTAFPEAEVERGLTRTSRRNPVPCRIG